MIKQSNYLRKAVTERKLCDKGEFPDYKISKRSLKVCFLRHFLHWIRKNVLRIRLIVAITPKCETELEK